MSRCQELQSQAAGLAALDGGDADRGTAYEHARSCPGCAAALREGERLVSLLSRAPPLPAPAPAALRRVSAAIEAELEGEAAHSRALPVLLAAAVALGWVVIIALARHRAEIGLTWAESGVVLALAALAPLAAWAWPARTLASLVLASLFFAVYAGAPGSFAALLGLKCAAIEIGAAALPFAGAWVLVARRRAPGGWPLVGAAAAAGALAGQAALHVECPASVAMPHLLAFHVGGVLLAAMLGSGAAMLREAFTERP